MVTRSPNHGLPAEDVDVGDRHAAGVLHRPGVVFRHEDLVVLGEGKWHVELLLEESDARLGAVEDVVVVDVFGQRLAGVDPEGDLGAAPGERVEIRGVGGKVHRVRP